MSFDYHRRFCVAPMMRYSHRHARQLWRLLCPSALLYTEMLTADAVIYGNHQQLLLIPPNQGPVALQLAGNCPKRMATAAKIGVAMGYAEININCGCPSARVQCANFGACLMKQPQLVWALVVAIKQVVDIPVTVKCRLAVDDMEVIDGLNTFVAACVSAACDAVIVHARRAWLAGLNPAQNRHVPPLDYPRVWRLKQDFPSLPIIINGGITTIEQAKIQLSKVDGVMLGRAVCRQPFLLAKASEQIFGVQSISRQQVFADMLKYVQDLSLGEARKALMAMTNLNHGQANNIYFRRGLSKLIPKAGLPLNQIARPNSLLSSWLT